jgi:nucleoside-diphosphate-sugar epimerase
MRVLVTGARGKVGRATTAALVAAGHEVVGTDLGTPAYALPLEDGVGYVQADLCDPGDAFAVSAGMDAVLHLAAIPTHLRNTGHTVFRNNVISTYNLVEAAAALGVRRFVNLSSAVVGGYTTATRTTLPAYLPADEDEPIRPEDSYALSKYVGEVTLDAATRRTDLRAISLRPSWVQRPEDYAMNLGPGLQQRHAKLSRWSYVDIADLVDAMLLAVASDLPGHEVFHIAAPDNTMGVPLADLVAEFYPGAFPLREVAREDASAISCAKAVRLLGWSPSRSWRDHLTPGGEPLASP